MSERRSRVSDFKRDPNKFLVEAEVWSRSKAISENLNSEESSRLRNATLEAAKVLYKEIKADFDSRIWPRIRPWCDNPTISKRLDVMYAASKSGCRDLRGRS